MTKLSFSGVGSGQRKTLADAGIRVQLLDQATSTIIIDSSELRAALDLLEATAEPADSESQYQGIVAMKLVPRRVRRVETVVPRAKGSVGDAAGRAQYVSVCGKRIEKLTKKAEKAVADQKKKLAKATAKMFAFWRKDAFAERDENALRERRSRLLAEFELLKTAPHVRAVRMSASTVVVSTDLLSAVDPKSGNAHEIGQFTILIDLDGGNGVRWFNRDRRLNAYADGMNAPNVLADGSACANDTYQPMSELTARLELSVVVDLAIQFIENAGNSEFANYVSLWPRRW